ncbi:MAG: hypothetical protein HZB92_05320 [Euryarchaeota archaeon]|nr:hypothetical protein [Euryarchaeota archaeon]
MEKAVSESGEATGARTSLLVQRIGKRLGQACSLGTTFTLATYLSSCPYLQSMDKGELFRKVFHLCAPLFLLYYAVPSDMWGLGPTREIVLLVILLMVLTFDLTRYGMGVTLPFLRGYEARRISAYSWAAIGFTIAVTIFPMHLVVPVIFGLGWTDPLIGVLRRRKSKLYPALPVVVYFIICAMAFALMGAMGVLYLLLMPAIGALTAVAAESPRFGYVDDDFLMQIVPLAALWAMEYAWTALL